MKMNNYDLEKQIIEENRKILKAIDFIKELSKDNKLDNYGRMILLREILKSGNEIK